MAENIVSNLTVTAIPGVDLIYLEEKGSAGIHVSGLAKLIGCDPTIVRRAIERLDVSLIFEAEIQTPGGLQGVTFILEPGVIQILEAIMDGRHKSETKKTARELYRRFAIAGFKLYAMLQVAPQQLKTQAPIESCRIRRFAERICWAIGCHV